MKWKNETRRASRESLIGANVNLGDLHLHVHHYIGQGETWFVTCSPFYIKYRLNCETLEEAKDIAIKLLKSKLIGIMLKINEEK